MHRLGRVIGIVLLVLLGLSAVAARSEAGPTSGNVGASNGQLVLLTPERVLDTRHGVGAARATVPAAASLPVSITGIAGVPDSGVAAVAVTLTVANPAGPGYVTASGHQKPRPATSNLTFAAGQSTSNSLVITPGADGKADLYNGSTKPINLILDITGYYLSADEFSSSVGAAGRSKDNPGETTLTAANADTLKSAWAHDSATDSQAVQAIVDGIAYVPSQVAGSASPYLDALDVTTGATLWRLALLHCDDPDRGMAIAGNMAFIPCADSGSLVAVRLDTHELAWWRQVAAVQTYDNVVATDGSVFVLNDDRSLLAFDAMDGALRFRIDTNGGFSFTARDGRLFLAAGLLRVYDDQTGELLWTGTTNTDGRVSVDTGHALITGERIEEFPEAGCGRAVCLPTWQVSAKAPADPPDADCTANPGATDGHTLAVTISYCGRERLELINESTGATTQTFYAPGDMVVGDNVVQSGNLLWVPLYHSATQNGFYAYDATCTEQCGPVAHILYEAAGDNPAPTIAASHGTVLVQGFSNSPNLTAYRAN